MKRDERKSRNAGRNGNCIGEPPPVCYPGLGCGECVIGSVRQMEVDVCYVTQLNETCGQSQSICIYLFYGQGCPHCERVRPLIDEFAVKYPQVQLKTYEIYFNTTNQVMFREFLERYDVKEEGIPTLFIGDRALIGETAIRTQLEERIVWYTNNPAVCPATYTKSGGLPHDLSPAKPVDLTVPSILIAAVIDSVNPCAFAVLIILLAYLASLGERRRIAAVGCAYIATVFVVYFVAGLGLLTVVQQIGLSGIVFTIAAVVAIIAGLINIAEVLLKREIFTLAIPVSQKGAIDRYIRKASIQSAIALGALVSMVELPCTGGIYLAILGLLGDRMTLAEGIPYLLLYNLIFVLPLILILIIMYWAVLRSGWKHSKRGAGAGCVLSWALSWLHLERRC